MIKKKCKTCKKEFFVIFSRKKTAKFCSRKCIKITAAHSKTLGDRLRALPRNTEWNKKIGLTRINQKNPMWKGKRASLKAIHHWIRIRKPKPAKCVDCKRNEPRDLANISQKYHRDVNDFEWLCRRCHMTKDGRIEILVEKNKDIVARKKYKKLDYSQQHKGRDKKTGRFIKSKI